MAISAWTVKLTAALADGKYHAISGSAAAVPPSTAALDSAMATLVADGATPTQGHVTTANAALTAFETLLTAATGADVTLLVNPATVSKMNQIKAAFDRFSHLLSGAGFTP